MANGEIVTAEIFHPDAFPFSTNNPSGVPSDTKIEPSVVAAIVGNVVSGVSGVDRLSNTGGILRAVADTVWSTATARATGVGVESGQKEAIIDQDVVMVYGHRITSAVQEIRETVAQELFDQIGLVAKEINVVVGIEFPAGSPSRGVQ